MIKQHDAEENNATALTPVEVGLLNCSLYANASVRLQSRHPDGEPVEPGFELLLIFLA